MGDRQTRISSSAFGLPVPADRFVTLGPEAKRTRFTTKLGLESRVKDRVGLGLGYRGDYQSGYKFHQGEAVVKVSW